MKFPYLSENLFEGKSLTRDLYVEQTDIKDASISIDGYKHSLVQVIALTVALKMKVMIENPPLVSDTYVFIAIINEIGGNAKLIDNKLFIDATEICNSHIPVFTGKLIHGTMYLCPAFITAMGRFGYYGSGGCQIGSNEDANTRPLSHILSVMKKFGTDIELTESGVFGKAGRNNTEEGPDEIDIFEYSTSDKYLSGPLVGGATKTALIMAAPKEHFVLRNAYLKTDVYDMVDFLRVLGKDVKIIDNDIVCSGKLDIDKEKVYSFRLTQCISEIVTYATLFVLSNKKITFLDLKKDTIQRTLKPELTLFEKMGISTIWNGNDLTISREGEINSIDIDVTPLTIQSDHHPFFTLLDLSGNRTSEITEYVWKDRFMYVDNLKKMGADIEVSGNKILMHPSKSKPYNKELPSMDVRSAAVSLVAIISSGSKCMLTDVVHLLRGYSRLKEQLSKMGVTIQYKDVVRS